MYISRMTHAAPPHLFVLLDLIVLDHGAVQVLLLLGQLPALRDGLHKNKQSEGKGGGGGGGYIQKGGRGFIYRLAANLA